MSRVPESDSGETTIEDIAPEDLTAYLTGDKRGILEFYTNSCPYCVMIEPELEELKAKYGEEIFIVKINAERYLMRLVWHPRGTHADILGRIRQRQPVLQATRCQGIAGFSDMDSSSSYVG